MGDFTVINVVTDYGAHGDGIHDDTAAINNALAAVPNGTSPPGTMGAIVYFPAGKYLVSSPLIRQSSYTRCVGEGKGATVISVNPADVNTFISPVDSTLGCVFDIETTAVTDCSVMDLTIDGMARNMGGENPEPNNNYCGGIYCTAGEQVERVVFYDVFGWAIWLNQAPYAKVIDCDADLGTGPGMGHYGNDCIGGAPFRVSIIRFHWFPTMSKPTALDVTNSPGEEVSIDILDCINESAQDVILEGCVRSNIVGCRFYGSDLLLQSDAYYYFQHTDRGSITNCLDILISECVFAPYPPDERGGATCKVHLEGGDNNSAYSGIPINLGGRIAIVNNDFYQNNASPIQWAGDDISTSVGCSIISNNRISGANQTDYTSPRGIQDSVGYSLGELWASGISVLASYGLVISGNTIEDTNAISGGFQYMRYSIQLGRADAAQPGQTGRILVEANICGYAPGLGNGVMATFYFGNFTPSATNPLPIVRDNTNQFQGYDSSVSFTNGIAWPPAGAYQYDAVVTVAGGTSPTVLIGSEGTGLGSGPFYIPVGQTITVSWSGAGVPTIRVFAS
jgi:hypothetical protein